MKLVQAQEENLLEILSVLREGQAFLKTQGVDQWQNGYPNQEVVLRDIRRGEAWMLREAAQTFGVMTLGFGGEPTYQIIHEGYWPDEDPYAVIHRLAVTSSTRKSGIGSLLVEEAKTLALARGIAVLRADTHRKNLPMRAMLEKNGFFACGLVYMEDGGERIAYHRRISLSDSQGCAP